jgi:ubiquinone biosynthesis protein UbiJ
MFSPLDLSLKPLEYSVNLAISLDPQAKQKVKEFNNQVISFDIKGLPFSIYIKGQEDHFIFSLQSESPALVSISGSSFAFMRCLVHKNPLQEFSAGDLVLMGESDLAESLFDLFKKLEIDWEEQLSKLFGDVPAHSLYTFLQKATLWGKDTISACMKNTSEYLQEEAPVMAPNAAITDFIQDVDTLRDDAERLAARVARLEKMISVEESQGN